MGIRCLMLKILLYTSIMQALLSKGRLGLEKGREGKRERGKRELIYCI